MALRADSASPTDGLDPIHDSSRMKAGHRAAQSPLGRYCGLGYRLGGLCLRENTLAPVTVSLRFAPNVRRFARLARSISSRFTRLVQPVSKICDARIFCNDLVRQISRQTRRSRQTLLFEWLFLLMYYNGLIDSPTRRFKLLDRGLQNMFITYALITYLCAISP